MSPAALITAKRRKELAALDGLVSEATGLRLAELAALVPANQVIVEIGSYKGKSGCYLAEGARRGLGAMVFCIDPWDLEGNVSGRFGFAALATFEAFAAQVASVKLDSQVTAIPEFSPRAASGWRLPIGLLYIDGSHLYEDVRADYRAWALRVAVGGAMAFDDYDTPRNPGVKRVVDYIRNHNATWQGWDFATPPLAIAWRGR